MLIRSMAAQVGVSEGRLRKWLLSITVLLRAQNGGILPALALWRRNCAKEFAGRVPGHCGASSGLSCLPWLLSAQCPYGLLLISMFSASCAADLEECLICVSVLSPANGQLPRLACQTCSKKFHPSCLYKWFKSSGKSSCPHCQSNWS